MCLIGCVIGAFFSLFSLTSPAATVPNPSGDGCIAAAGAACSYTAREAGVIQAVGNGWGVEIVRGDRKMFIGPREYLDVAGRVSESTAVIRPGDLVHAWTVAGPYQGSAVRVGAALAD